MKEKSLPPFQNDLALRFELTGGFIKNAILSALSIAVSRDGDNPQVCQDDLLQGANLQLRGRLRMKVSDRITCIHLGHSYYSLRTSIHTHSHTWANNLVVL